MNSLSLQVNTVNDNESELFRIERGKDDTDVFACLLDPELTMIIRKYLSSEKAYEINPKVVYIFCIFICYELIIAQNFIKFNLHTKYYRFLHMNCFVFCLYFKMPLKEFLIRKTTPLINLIRQIN
jgi:hypothetical protein